MVAPLLLPWMDPAPFPCQDLDALPHSVQFDLWAARTGALAALLRMDNATVTGNRESAVAQAHVHAS